MNTTVTLVFLKAHALLAIQDYINRFSWYIIVISFFSLVLQVWFCKYWKANQGSLKSAGPEDHECLCNM